MVGRCAPVWAPDNFKEMHCVDVVNKTHTTPSVEENITMSYARLKLGGLQTAVSSLGQPR